MHKYCLDFVLHIYDTAPKTLRNSLTEFTEKLEIVEADAQACGGNNFKIHIHTEDPTVIFDICAQFGRLKSVKVDEAQTCGI